jgi:hypothetical protein
MWTLNPPVYAYTCNPPVDSASGPGRYPGVFRSQQNHDAHWYLRFSNTTGNHDVAFSFGDTCDIPIVGDWDGDGDDTVGVWRNGMWHLNGVNGGGTPTPFMYGNPDDYPVAGDWDGDGDDTIGVFRPSEVKWYLRNSNDTGPASYAFIYGDVGDRPIVGDWDGTGGSHGTVTVGVFRPSNATWHLRNWNSAGFPSIPAFLYGVPADTPVTGDWNWDSIDSIGVFRPAGIPQWKLTNQNGPYPPAYDYGYGALSDKPVTGDWN